jgi:osmotically inducible protein OsmC
MGCRYERRLNMSATTIVSREARTVWDGDLMHGSGNVSGMSGALDKLPVTFKSRIGSPDGRTSPEELIAAAHSSCFTMALANLLTQEGHPPAHLDVTADVTLDDTSGAPTITASALKVTVTRGRRSRRCRVPGLAGAHIGRHHRANDGRVGITHRDEQPAV